MEVFLLIVLVLGFLWLFIRQRTTNRRLRELEDLYRRMAQSTSLAPQQPVPAPRPTVVPAPSPAPFSQVVVPVQATEQRAPAPVLPYVAPFIPPPPPIELPTRPSPAPPSFASAAEPKPRVSLEARLGQNWLNKLGIVILVIGIALLLGRELTTLGPLGKSLIGFALALAILGLGLFLERRPNYRVFARACIGGGWALTFFLAFAIYHLSTLQILTSQTADLILMLAVASGMVVHSLRYHSQVVTTLAFLLAFLTVGISDVTLFSLVAGALLAGALAFIVYRERWYALGLAGLIGVYLNHFLWLHRVLPEGGLTYLHQHGHAFPEFLPSAILLLSYWLIFRLVYVFRAPLEGASYAVDQIYSTFAAILNSVGLLGLMKFQSSHPEWAFYGLLVLGTAELVLSFIARGIDPTKPRNRSGFIVLATIASVLLLAAIPFRFNGASWTLLWLLEAEAFFLVGVRLPETVFRRIGAVAALLTSAFLLFHAPSPPLVGNLVVPINPYIAYYGHLRTYCITLLVAALMLWFNAEFATRRWRFITASDFDRIILRVTSYAAVPLALWCCLNALYAFTENAVNEMWAPIAWFVLALVLAEVADRIASRDLATQSDVIALLAVINAQPVRRHFWETSSLDPHSVRHSVLLGASAALLYLGMRRKLASYTLPARWIAPTYSWIATAFIALLLWYQLEPISVAVAWGVFALVLFELGLVFKRDYLRHQAYALLAAAFLRVFFANLHVPSTTGALSPSLYTVIPLIAAFAYVYERVHADTTTTRIDRIAGDLCAWCGLVAACTLLYFELRPDWVILAWAVLAIALLALACLLKRKIFIAQALVVTLAAALRGILFHLFSPAPLATTFYTSRVFTIGLTSALLLLSLPLAFYLRHYFADQNLSSRPERAARSAETPVLGPATTLTLILHHPEQPWFFIPLILLTLLLYVQLRGGLITIGWVALGLITFLFALAVKERSYRLSGLGLLLLAVVKILAWDVWHVSPTDRYITLIVMGAALLLVSFLYSRYRETLLNFL